MKLPLATGLLSATIIACSGGANTTNTSSTSSSTTTNKLVMRVDRSLDKSAGGPAQKFPDDDIAAESYKPIAQPVDRWEVSIEGSHVILVPVTPLTSNQGQVEGVEISADKAKPGERRFDLQKGVFAGGRFVLRGDDAEVTMYGSGVPIVSSERGKLIKK